MELQVPPQVENEPQDVHEDEPQVVPEDEHQENEPQDVHEDELQVVPEYETHVVLEAEPQVVPEVEPQEHEPEVVPEDEPQVPEIEPQVVPEDEPQVVPVNEPQVVPENEPQVVQEDESQVVPVNEPQVVQENEPQVAPEAEPQVVPEDEQQVVPEDEPQIFLENVYLVVHENEPQVIPQNESQGVPIHEPQLAPDRDVISEDDWNEMCKKGKFKKEDMNMMVMDFLICHELPIVAEVFHRESGCPLDLDSEDLAYVGTQKIVRDLIVNRQFDDAIKILNETVTPVFLQSSPRLNFYLEQQKMIELCRKRNFNAALTFSREFVMWESFDCGYDVFNEECRLTLLLMLFGDDEESPASKLLDYRRIFWIANQVVDKMIRYRGRQRGNYIEKSEDMVRFEEYEIYQVVKFPLFNFDSGYPELY